MKPSRTSCRPSGSKTRAHQREQRQPGGLVVPDREEDAQQPLPRAVDATLGDRAAAPRAGRAAPAGRRRTGRPWSRSSGAPAPRPRRRPRRPRGPTCRRTPARRTASAPRPRIAARVSGEPGRRPRRAGDEAISRSAAKKCSRANSSDSRRSFSRSARAVGLAGVDLDHDLAAEAGAGDVPQELGGADRAPARAPGARPWPSRCRR